MFFRANTLPNLKYKPRATSPASAYMGKCFVLKAAYNIVKDDWRNPRATAREHNWTTFRRENAVQIAQARIGSLFFTETVRNSTAEISSVTIEVDPHQDLAFTGAFFHLALFCEC